MHFVKKYGYIAFLFIFSLWLYVYRVNYTVLTSWDEAWYASIAHEILKSGDWLTLHFNGEPFFDHPPMGFWIMATFYKLFGVSEFTTRLPSVIAGLGTSFLMYKLGEGLFKKKIIGFIAACILSTCVWYVLRVRSGNLDALSLFFYVATVYFAYLSAKSFKWFPLCAVAFGALVMTKTLAGVSAIVIILWFIIPYLFRSKWNGIYVIAGVALFCGIVVPWYRYHLVTNSSFYQYHFIHIGARDKSFSVENYSKLSWELPLFYLHMGVRKWYDPWLASLVVVGVLVLLRLFQAVKSLSLRKKFEKWQELHHLFAVIGWNMVVLVPFLTTDKTEIWHLIPVYAPLALIVAYGAYIVFDVTTILIKKIRISFISHLLSSQYVLASLYLLPFLFIIFLQIKTFYAEVFPSSKYVVDEVDILKKARKYNKTVVIDRDYVPIAVFYSQQRVKEQPRYASDAETVQNFIDQPEDAVLVTKNSAVEKYESLQKSTIKILEKNASYSIIEE